MKNALSLILIPLFIQGQLAWATDQFTVSPKLNRKILLVDDSSGKDLFKAIAFGDGPLAGKILRSNQDSMLEKHVRNDQELAWARFVEDKVIAKIESDDPTYFAKIANDMDTNDAHALMIAINGVKKQSYTVAKTMVSSKEFKAQFQSRFAGISVHDFNTQASTVILHEDVAVESEVAVVVVAAVAAMVIAMVKQAPGWEDGRPDNLSMRDEMLVRDIRNVSNELQQQRLQNLRDRYQRGGNFDGPNRGNE